LHDSVGDAPEDGGLGHGTPDARETSVMKDLVFVGVTVAFFALAWLYTKSLDRL
jgi:hypothetical protein